MSTNTGDDIVRHAMSMARRDANRNRLIGFGHSDFSAGHAFGQIVIAEIYLDADPLAVMAARNELHFLRRYTEGRA